MYILLSYVDVKGFVFSHVNVIIMFLSIFICTCHEGTERLHSVKYCTKILLSSFSVEELISLSKFQGLNMFTLSKIDRTLRA